MEHNHQVLEDMREPVAQLRQAIPGVFKAYADMHHAAMRDGVLPTKTKELIALA
ncbi:MAG: carboxymuconolactone decarboxylase family protein, partial [Candidatus Dormibacteraeota bacterium]|nr:carboxymuconolactone decarboxylase family protein [Candidatus Dormibacteraeota bacterium]